MTLLYAEVSNTPYLVSLSLVAFALIGIIILFWRMREKAWQREDALKSEVIKQGRKRLNRICGKVRK